MMKMYDKIKHLKKEYVYEYYTRIVDNFKDYEKISRVKMLDEIYAVYNDYHTIINICTVRELKYLKMILNDKYAFNSQDEKYDWERSTLINKFLLLSASCDKSCIPEELLDNVKLALKNVKWQDKETLDSLNEILVGYCKIQGSSLLSVVASVGSGITGCPKEIIWQHMLNDRLFNYYVYIVTKNFESIGDDILVAIYQDYYGIEEELDHQRKLQGLVGEQQIDVRLYKSLFYHDFDLQNPKIKKFLDELKKLPFFWFSAIRPIREFAMLNLDREPLKSSLQNLYFLRDYDLTKFFQLMDEAMDEMPSGALNGFTPNEAKKLKLKSIHNDIKKKEAYVKQQNACLARKDAKLFYKIYFALLDFTNKKYKINQKVKIYNHHGINPYEINDIVDTFWENKEGIVLEFCFANPYKFNKKELEFTKNFKNGIRNLFIIAKYELEYTAFMDKDKIYMVKGLNDNIDNIISYQELPYVVTTSIIPFGDVLVYDGLLSSINVKMSIGFDDVVDKEYDQKMKCYHL